MKSFTADFGLALQSGEVVVGKLLKAWFLAGHNHALYRLGQQELVMERNKAALISE